MSFTGKKKLFIAIFLLVISSASFFLSNRNRLTGKKSSSPPSPPAAELALVSKDSSPPQPTTHNPSTTLRASPQPTTHNSQPKSLASPGRQTYSITTSHRSPELYKAVIDPEDVRVGQTQTMTVYVKEDKEENFISSVVAKIQTDKETLSHDLKLKSGSQKDGVWEGSWTVHDTHETTYVTTFIAKNNRGEVGEARLSWTDPGCGCNGTNCTISSTCTVSGDEGANGGTLTITGSVTVPNSTYLTYGTTLNISGTLNLNSGGVLKSGSICGGVGAGVACTGTDYCSGNTRYYNFQCNGSGSCAAVSSEACATAGTCQTGGGCSGGSCVSVGYTPNGEQGINCTATHYRCDGNGGCTAPCSSLATCWDAGQTCSQFCTPAYGHCACAGGGVTCVCAQGCGLPWAKCCCYGYLY